MSHATLKTIHIIQADEEQSLILRLGALGYGVVSHPSSGALLASLPRFIGDCAIIDASVALEIGPDAVHRLTTIGRGLGTVVLVDPVDLAGAIKCMKLGAIDVIERGFDEQRIAQGVEIALEVSAKIKKFADFRVRLEYLSSREREVVECIAVGETNKAVGRRLGISPRTVEVHRHRAMLKLRVPNHAELVLLAATIAEDDNYTGVIGGWPANELVG